MKLLVFGGRDYSDEAKVFAVLDKVHAKRPVTMLIEGGADGADWLGGQWAKSREVPRLIVYARWKTEGRSAGPKRNARMIEHKPDGAVQFPGGVGTADMRRRCDEAGIRVLEIDPTNLTRG
jgi:hypothetical protein